jgi:hypothetical protein
MPLQPTGHPDWISANSAPIPVLVDQILGQAPGGYGPFTIDCTSGGAYILAVSAQFPAELSMVDVTVEHFDVAGNLVYTDIFGAVPVGGTGTTVISLPGPTILRGNIYGSSIVISGAVASSAYLTAVTGVGGLTASNIDISVYILPTGLSDPEPKMCNGSVILAGYTAPTPGGLLQGVSGKVIPISSNSGPLLCAPYSGPATLIYEVSGAAAIISDFVIQLLFYTVAGGSGSYLQIPIVPTAVNITYALDIDLPASGTFLKLINNNAANTETFNVSLIAQASA